MSDAYQRLVVADLSGGRNAIDPPLSPRFGPTECVDAVNIDYYRSTLGNKRNGLSSITTLGFTAVIGWLARYVPTTDDTSAEMWAQAGATTGAGFERLSGTTWLEPIRKDNPTGNAWDVTAASLNGKFFIAYKSAVGRLHCWDGSTVRRTGLAVPISGVAGFATIANTAVAGAYPNTTRYYRMRYTEQSSGVTIRRSEPGAGLVMTPDGAHTGVTITISTGAGEGETHWELEASTDNVTFYRIATTLTSSITVTDTALVSTYSSNPVSAATGTYTIQKSYRFIAADQGRLVGFGSWTTTDKQNDIEVSGVIGSLDVGDAERVDTTVGYRYTLDENDSGAPTGLCGPLFGNFYAFKARQLWELAPTGNANSPYRRSAISKTIGCVQAPASCLGEDPSGNPALYFMSHRGMYRYGVAGLEYIGKGIEDYILGPTATINLSASKVIAHMQYHVAKRQVWAWWATGSSNDPCQCAFYDVEKHGWSRVPTGDKLANARCSVMFANTIAVLQSSDLKPYIGYTGASATIYKGDDSAVTADDGTAFQAYTLLKPIEPGGPGFNGHVGDAMLLAKASTGVTITATVVPDFNAANATTGTALLTPTTTETRVDRRLEGSALAGVAFVQYQIGDASAVSNAWTLDRLVIPYSQQEAKSA